MLKFDGANWTVYDRLNSGLPANDVLSLAIDENNHKWVGTGGSSISCDEMGQANVKTTFRYSADDILVRPYFKTI